MEEPSARPTGTVTFLFTDIEGSTRMWEGNPSAMRKALARHDGIVQHAIEANGGFVFKTVGDAFCCAFSDAHDALGAALVAQRALLGEPWEEGCEIRARMAVHTGEAEEQDGDYFGQPVNRVARLLSAGHGGQTLLSRSTAGLLYGRLPLGVRLRDLGERRLKDLVLPERVFEMTVPDLPYSFPPLKTLDARANNLPSQTTPLLGRGQEVAEVCGLLRRDGMRLLTLTGPGGTGKTRLALQAAAEVLDEFEGGACFVALEAVRDPAFVPSAIARPLGVTEGGGRPLSEELEAHLADKELLLVLDNFEQVLGAAALVGKLLASCPRLKVLVTSRAPTNAYGEREYPVPPLALPDPSGRPEDLGHYGAVELFVERARASSPALRLTAENASAIAEICARLDGLPLAIELAAARTKLLHPRALLERLGDRLKLLRDGARDLPERQRTLRGTIDWSHRLLGERDAVLFRRLSVFNGGFALEAAEEVCDIGGGLDVLNGVQSLLDMSLLTRGGPGGEKDAPHFRMLQTVREYALERLREAGDAEDLRAHHAAYYLAFAEAAEPDLAGPRAASRADELEEEHDNLRAALSWFLSGGDENLGLRLACALWWFWYLHGHYTEGRGWLEKALAGDARNPSAQRAKALGREAFLALLQSDLARAEDLAEEGLDVATATGDEHAAAVAGLTLGHVALYGGDYGRAEGFFRDALAAFRRLGDGRDVGWALFALGSLERFRQDLFGAKAYYEESLALLEAAGDADLREATVFNLGDVSMLSGDLPRAEGIFEETLASARSAGNGQNVVLSAANLGQVALLRGDHERAVAFLRESLALGRELGHDLDVAAGLESLAAVAAAQDQDARAARLWGAAGALREDAGAAISPADLGVLWPFLERSRARTGEVPWREALAEGRSLGAKRAVSLALGPGDLPSREAGEA